MCWEIFQVCDILINAFPILRLVLISAWPSCYLCRYVLLQSLVHQGAAVFCNHVTFKVHTCQLHSAYTVKSDGILLQFRGFARKTKAVQLLMLLFFFANELANYIEFDSVINIMSYFFISYAVHFACNSHLFEIWYFPTTTHRPRDVVQCL